MEELYSDIASIDTKKCLVETFALDMKSEIVDDELENQLPNKERSLGKHNETVKEEVVDTFECLDTSILNCSSNNCNDDQDSKDPLHICGEPSFSYTEQLSSVGCNIEDSKEYLDIKIEINEEEQKPSNSQYASNPANISGGSNKRKYFRRKKGRKSERKKSQKETNICQPKKPRGRPKKVLTEEEELALKNKTKKPVRRPKDGEKEIFLSFRKEDNSSRSVIHSTKSENKCNSAETLNRNTYVQYDILYNNGEKLYVCKICKKTFVKLATFSMHFKCHGTGFSCNDCQKMFSTKKHLRSHMSVHTGLKPFVCQICGAGFSWSYTLLSHVNVRHNIPNLYSCDICGKSYTRKNSLNRHILGHMNIETRIITCNICGIKLKTKTDMSRHMTTHTGEKPFPCDICGKRFSQMSSRNAHKKCHLNTQYSCKICGRSYKLERTLHSHIKTHDCIKYCKCEICGKLLKNSNMSAHMKIHVNVKLYMCDVCSTFFNTKANVRQHMIVHSKEKNHNCSLCTKSFRKRYELLAHEQTHSSYRSHICEVCGKSYKSSNGLTQHMGFHSTVKPYKCDICGKCYPSKRPIFNHIRLVHTGIKKLVSCDICGKYVSSKASLLRHLLYHDNVSPYKCNVCCNSFREKHKLAKHMIVHNSVHGHLCKVCGASFSNKTCLTKHLRVHKMKNS